MYRCKIKPTQFIATVFVGFAAILACVFGVTEFASGESTKPLKPEQLAAVEIRKYLKENPLKLAPDETFVDGVRRFVTDNSVHKIDETFRSYNDNLGLMMRKILRHAQGLESPPHLECSSRSGAMLEILDAFGIRSRQTFLFTDSQAELKSHTLLEVWNDSSGRWEIQDPDYATYYVQRNTGNRVGAERIVKEPIDHFVPCRGPGDCDWKYASVLRDFFEVVGYENRIGELIVVVNRSRFELGKIFDHPSGRHDLEKFIQREWSSLAPVIQVIE